MDNPPTEVPPIPDEGLPPGWSIEQWNAYGVFWIQQEQEKSLNQVKPEIETSESDAETELNIPNPIISDDNWTEEHVNEPVQTIVLPTGNEQVLIDEDLTGSEELAILIGGLFIFYGMLDFLMWLIFGIWFPGPGFTPIIFGLVGGGIINSKSYWNVIELKPFSESHETKKLLGGVLGVALLLILVIFIFSIMDEEIVGTWHNPAQTLTFNSDGTVTGAEFTEWRVDGDILYLVYPDEPDFEYYYKYTISNEVLFIAPMDFDDNGDITLVVSEECSAFAEEGIDWEEAEYSTWPSWCDTE
jgi:hypothetical protein